ncbi:MAG: hypothetical protein P3A28_05830 [Gemmatimonadota bacterium]|nr:hypothetical protein [Gemmatimonadota bacterium]
MRVSLASRHFVRRSAIGLAVGVAAASLASAQTSLGSQPIPAFSTFYVTTGTLLMDVSRLNPHFERNDLAANLRPGFYTISNDGYSLGVGGYGPVFNRLLAGGEWHTAQLGEEASPSGKTNALSTNYVMGTLGFAIWTSWRLNVAAFAGVGPGKVKLTLTSRDGGPTVSPSIDPTFDEIVLASGARSVIEGSYLMVQPGMAVDFLMLRQTVDRVGLTLGVRFSSLISPNRTTWTYEGRTVFGGPDAGPTGGSVRVLVGVGGFRMGGSR